MLPRQGPCVLLASMRNCPNPFQHCSLQADEVEPLMWLVRGGCALATCPTVSAANSGVLSLSEHSQEPLHRVQAPLSSLFDTPTAEIASTASRSGTPSSQYSSSESDVSDESSSDYDSSGSDGETNALENMLMTHPSNTNPADAVLRSMQMLRHINSLIQGAELDLGLQLLGCEEPYHRIRLLKRHYLVARRSVERIGCRLDKQELHRICEDYYCADTLPDVERSELLHANPEIKSKDDKAVMVGRAFTGDPKAICDVLFQVTY